jgi:hypothetical protein
MKIVNTCACGAQYSMAEWMGLPLKGVQKFDDDPDDPEGPIPPLELRDCVSCGSTRAIEIVHDTLAPPA